MKTLFYHAQIILPDKIEYGFLTVSDGKILEVCKGDPSEAVFSSCVEAVDCGGKYLSPGFVDIHTHGAGGCDFTDGTEEAIQGACLEHLRHGTTTIFPTTMTCPDEDLFTFFEK